MGFDGPLLFKIFTFGLCFYLYVCHNVFIEVPSDHQKIGSLGTRPYNKLPNWLSFDVSYSRSRVHIFVFRMTDSSILSFNSWDYLFFDLNYGPILLSEFESVLLEVDWRMNLFHNWRETHAKLIVACFVGPVWELNAHLNFKQLLLIFWVLLILLLVKRKA